MQDDLDDFESPYFDWDNDRMFDEAARTLIDKIANDPRFYSWADELEIVEDLAPEKGTHEQRGLLQAAREVFELTVLPGLEARASQLVDHALADPDLEHLPPWNGESGNADVNFPWGFTDPDPRVAEEFDRQLAASDVYRRMQEEARGRAESEARAIVGELPHRVRDLLVLASRNADRESLLEPWNEGASYRRRGWIAYYAQRIAREVYEESVLDRYSAAVKSLFSQGWRKKAIAESLEISAGRVDRLLDRKSGLDIADNDPLCGLVPELRGCGDAWRAVDLMRARKPKPFSGLSVDEKVALVEDTPDPELLRRLAKQGTRRTSEAIIDRHRLRGDIADDVLLTILSAYPGSWMRQEMIEAHRARPLPTRTALALADEDARVLLDCDDSTVLAARRIGRADFDMALAFRTFDVDVIERVLTAGSQSESFRYLVGLLVERPLTHEMIESDALSEALLFAAERVDDPELITTLRLIACQNPDIVTQHAEAANAGGTSSMSPVSIVSVALGKYHLSGSKPRVGVRSGAQALWAAVDLTDQHRVARVAVAEHGSDVVTLESTGNTFVATADAIRSFRKTETIEYTYVHMHLTSAVEVGNLYFQMPNGLPALGYHREMRKHPLDADGPDVQAIVWPIPFEPGIYSLDVPGGSAGLIAVSGGKVAVVGGP